MAPSSHTTSGSPKILFSKGFIRKTIPKKRKPHKKNEDSIGVTQLPSTVEKRTQPPANVEVTRELDRPVGLSE